MFYARCVGGMRGLVYVLTGSPEAIDDVVQQSFASVFTKYCDGELRNPELYVKQTVINGCRRWRRQQAVRRDRVEPEPLDVEYIDIADDQTTLDDTVANRDELWAALDRLPEDHRHAVALRYLEDLSYDEIAQLLSSPDRAVSVSTVRTWVRRGLHRLTRECA